MKKLLISLIVIFSILIIHQNKDLFLAAVSPASSSATSFSVNNLDGVDRVDEFSAEVPTVTAKPQPTSAVIAPWPVYRNEPGLTIYKEDSKYKNYLFVIDPAQLRVSVQNVFTDIHGQWDQAKNPVCVFNGAYYEPDSSPSTPLIVAGNILPGKVTSNFSVRIMYITGNSLSVEAISANSDVRPADFAMSGLTPATFNGEISSRTVISAKDDILYVSITQDRSVGRIVSLHTSLGIEEKDIIVLDGGGSTMAICYGEDLLVQTRKIGSSVVISNP